MAGGKVARKIRNTYPSSQNTGVQKQPVRKSVSKGRSLEGVHDPPVKPA